ncbi:hypothetical protein T07_6485 [Trichinella nelsoni]|uniref:Uncharacterized protein n=1 Tax=Trichinella nelsoni TaxID=6336 RepID=A0A0V0SHT7_9BILA|nr:hypothetical protein T07_6485 [Trichinella nelsoni]
MPSDPLLEKDQKTREVNPVNVNLASQNKSRAVFRQIGCGTGARSERGKLSVTVHGFGGGSKDLQEFAERFHLSPLSGGPRKLIEALTTKKLCVFFGKGPTLPCRIITWLLKSGPVWSKGS